MSHSMIKKNQIEMLSQLVLNSKLRKTNAAAFKNDSQYKKHKLTHTLGKSSGETGITSVSTRADLTVVSTTLLLLKETLPFLFASFPGTFTAKLAGLKIFSDLVDTDPPLGHNNEP